MCLEERYTARLSCTPGRLSRQVHVCCHGQRRRGVLLRHAGRQINCRHAQSAACCRPCWRCCGCVCTAANGCAGHVVAHATHAELSIADVRGVDTLRPSQPADRPHCGEQQRRKRSQLQQAAPARASTRRSLTPVDRLFSHTGIWFGCARKHDPMHDDPRAQRRCRRSIACKCAHALRTLGMATRLHCDADSS